VAYKKILVTGAGGFIGSHLVEKLVKQKYKVRALVHYNSSNYLHNLHCLPEYVLSQLDIVSGDILDERFCRDITEDIDAVFHLAALISIPYSYQAVKPFIYTNIVGTENLVRASLENEVRLFVHTSTSEVYGTAQYVPIDEKHLLQGQSPYAASKIGADYLVMSYVKSFDLPAVIIRPFNTFGPWQSRRAIIPTIITQLLSPGKELKLGSLEPVRDLNYIDNTVHGFEQCLRVPLADYYGEVFNIAYGEGISIGRLTSILQKIAREDKMIVEEPQRIRPAKSEVMKLVGDYKRARNVLNYHPLVSMPEGLELTYRWYAEYYRDPYLKLGYIT